VNEEGEGAVRNQESNVFESDRNRKRQGDGKEGPRGGGQKRGGRSCVQCFPTERGEDLTA